MLYRIITGLIRLGHRLDAERERYAAALEAAPWGTY